VFILYTEGGLNAVCFDTVCMGSLIIIGLCRYIVFQTFIIVFIDRLLVTPCSQLPAMHDAESQNVGCLLRLLWMASAIMFFDLTK